MGRRRTTNEDSFLLCEPEGLGVVCDGMGGHHAGEVASRLAVDIFAEQVAKVRDLLAHPGRKLSLVRAMAQDFVLEWTQQANAAIHAQGLDPGGDQSSHKSRMGTTLALVLFVTDFVVVAHVGDSRVYRLRDGAIERLTEDHVVMAAARREPGDTRPPRNRKYVTRSLGTRAAVEPDIQLLEVAPGDLFLLCSDGLTDLVTDEEIRDILHRAGTQRRLAVRSLIHLANRRGGPDNVTVVVAEVVSDEADDGDDTDLLEAPPGA